MRWTVVYFEQADTTQPAEVFEDSLRIFNPKLRGKSGNQRQLMICKKHQAIGKST
jgi:rRNA pseudouridine-1189 N-methylase Emg1 (Nep1/Mra1 family)